MKQKIIYISTLLTVIIFSACMPIHSPKDNDDDNDILLLKKQIDETDRKVKKNNDKISEIENTIDNHEKIIKELEKNIKNVKKREAAPSVIENKNRSEPSFNKKRTKRISSSSVSAEKTCSDSLLPAETLYKKAISAYKNKNYTYAVHLFKSVADNYPEHHLSDNALYWIGECFYTRKDYLNAISAFKKIVEKYPKGNKMPDALLKTGYAYLSLDDSDNARRYLKRVVENYPFSQSGNIAEKKLRQIRSETKMK